MSVSHCGGANKGRCQPVSASRAPPRRPAASPPWPRRPPPRSQNRAVPAGHSRPPSTGWRPCCSRRPRGGFSGAARSTSRPGPAAAAAVPPSVPPPVPRSLGPSPGPSRRLPGRPRRLLRGPGGRRERRPRRRSAPWRQEELQSRDGAGGRGRELGQLGAGLRQLRLPGSRL